MTNNDIIVSNKDFNIEHVLECGQVFRFVKKDTHYSLRTLDRECILYNRGDEIVIENEDREYFTNYFDLNTDYGEIKRLLKDLPFMSEAVDYGYGIRILNQDPFETIISFIISANNNIPRIKKIIERICNNSAFPSAKELASHDKEYYSAMGAGYRDSYLVKTSNLIAKGSFDVDIIRTMPTDEAAKYLCKSLSGVGPKVADCILLFGYHKMDVFPVDTWIAKVYSDIYKINESNRSLIRSKLIETYGDMSGYAQQYLFYNKRDNG